MGFPVWTSPCVPKSKDRQSKMPAEQVMKPEGVVVSGSAKLDGEPMK